VELKQCEIQSLATPIPGINQTNSGIETGILPVETNDFGIV